MGRSDASLGVAGRAVCTTSCDWLVSLTLKGAIACERVQSLIDGSECSRRGGWRGRTKGLKNHKSILRTTEPRLGLKARRQNLGVIMKFELTDKTLIALFVISTIIITIIGIVLSIHGLIRNIISLIVLCVFSTISISSLNTTRWIQLDGKLGDFILYFLLYVIINVIVGGIIILMLIMGIVLI